MSKEYDEGIVDRLFPDFQKAFQKNLDIALSSGAIGNGMMEDAPFLVYRAILLITAEQYWHARDDKFLKNLRHFV